MRSKVLLAAGTSILAAGMLLAATPQRWFNVDVTEHDEGTEVHLHLPVALVQTVLGAVDTGSIRHGDLHVDCGDVHVDWPAVMKELRAAPEGQYVTVKGRDGNVVMSKAGGLVRIDVRERHGDEEQVEVTLPATLLDAFGIDDEGRIDLKALAAGLGSPGPGDLVRVKSKDASVRIWME